jgi:hypothetical protein
MQITSFEGPTCGNPRWSPDSRWLALDSRVEESPEIYVVHARLRAAEADPEIAYDVSDVPALLRSSRSGVREPRRATRAPGPPPGRAAVSHAWRARLRARWICRVARGGFARG